MSYDLFYMFLDQLAKILLRIFASIFIKDIGLQFCFVLSFLFCFVLFLVVRVILSDFGMRVMVAS